MKLNYWLVAYETCHKTALDVEPGDVAVNQDLDKFYPDKFYHEGFFWLCSFKGRLESSPGDNLLKFWFTNQQEIKECKPAFLFPFPVSVESHNTTIYDSAIIYRGFWSIFLLVGVAAVVLGGFIIICAAPFASHCLYKAGGGLYLISVLFVLAATVMSVIWNEALHMIPQYEQHHQGKCEKFQVNIMYGISFMLAPVGVFFCLLAGLLFLLIGRSLQMHSK
ncbi:transmembrane protein 182 isoform X2 [Denticeps clupeoides]|uniref:transmembrane protein 182 isoform X2 n=1 Tax=Denticeps clupeoides TaxID=299321 RepID=UPI0010A376BD|nr:transmembrane protein 182-like isoform X2 [Denticeps clupeoides]